MVNPKGNEWKLDKQHLIVMGADNKAVCYLYADTRSYKEALANARLIVAAVNACLKLNPKNPTAVAEGIPGLYEACIVARGFLACYEDKAHKEIADVVRQAVADVKGDLTSEKGAKETTHN